MSIKKSIIIKETLKVWEQHGDFTDCGICRALYKTSQVKFPAVVTEWYDLIGDMLRNYDYVENWLYHEQKIPRKLLTKAAMYRYRGRWLKYLMNYYRAQGD